MTPPPTPSPLPRIAAFERLGYGLFLHWGLYSQLGRGEWIQAHRGIPNEEYAQLIRSFTASQFSAPSIARLARESGMRYVCLTTRHHEGFSLYDTRGLSDFDAPHSPAGRDLVAEFAEACRNEGLAVFFYHTTLDWRWDSAHCDDGKFEDYLEYLNASIEILSRHYGKVGGFWFDGNWSRQADWREDRLYRTIRTHQPEAIIINNTGLNAQGVAGHRELDSVTFEQGLPAAPNRAGWPKYLAGEMCETLSGHWGFARNDYNWKSPAQIIAHLCACRKTGANYLLNVGPTAEGAIPDYEAALLRKVGGWIASHGHMIYDSRPVRASCQGRDFLLEAGDRYYYFAHDLNRQGDAHVVVGGREAGLRAVRGIERKITGARWLDASQDLKFFQSGNDLCLDLSGYEYGDDWVVRVAELI